MYFTLFVKTSGLSVLLIILVFFEINSKGFSFNFSKKVDYDNECKKFIIKLTSLLPEIKKTLPSTIINAYDRKKKYKMKFLGLMKCESQEQFEKLTKNIYL